MTISHSQYYTSDKISSLMMSCISKEDVSTILDLGAGNGALVKAALQKWNNVKCIVADIDKANCQCLMEQGYETHNIDCVMPNLEKKLCIYHNTIDVGVCNPPYEVIENQEFIGELLERAHLRMNRREKHASSDLVFLVYNLLFLKPQGVLGIIVPYSIMTGRNYASLRQSLLENYYVERAIELPEKSFSYTEAKTGILIIRKEKSNGRRTKLNTVSEDSKLSDSISVPSNQLSLRIDYSFHQWKKTQGKKEYRNENEITIIRGRLSHDELKKNGKPFFHTTCYGSSDIDWLYRYDNNDKSIVESGCFLIARVGKRCVGRVKYLEKGNIQISDCIYGVTVPKDYIEEFKTFFQSNEYSDFIKVVARGVCSLYICKEDLAAMLLKKLYEFRSLL